MAGSTIGKLFTVTTFGESHGAALGCIVDGCPPNLELSGNDIQKELDRRRPGTSRYTTQRREPDQVSLLSGLFQGRTTGTPIGMIIHNVDQKSRDYKEISSMYRPGHGDYTYHHKYGAWDYRGGGRASARETAMRVAAGAIAKKYLSTQGILVRACLTQMGTIKMDQIDWSEVNNNPFFCPDRARITELSDLIQTIRKQGDSIGARITVEATGLMPGLGEPVFDRLDADLAHALMSINAVKGVEIGDGFDTVSQRGSEHRDEITPEGFLSNHAGGVLAGISTGQTVRASIALKPTSSIMRPGRTMTRTGEAAEVVTRGRHDPCVGIRAVPIAEAMVAIVLMDHLLRHRGQNGEVVSTAVRVSAQVGDVVGRAQGCQEPEPTSVKDRP